jgi:hypothetical protein
LVDVIAVTEVAEKDEMTDRIMGRAMDLAGVEERAGAVDSVDAASVFKD